MNILNDILDKCRKNDRNAQAELYKALAPKLLGLCLRYMQDRDEAEDVMQDSFVKIFMNLESYKGEGSFEGWAKRIAANTALNALKKKNKIWFERDLSVIEHTDDAQDEVHTELTVEELMNCLQLLPPGYRTIINLFLVEEFSHKEIAEQLSISESTSRSQYARARQALIKLIKERQMVKGSKYA